jgi:hypothetical protein
VTALGLVTALLAGCGGGGGSGGGDLERADGAHLVPAWEPDAVAGAPDPGAAAGAAGVERPPEAPEATDAEAVAGPAEPPVAGDGGAPGAGTAQGPATAPVSASIIDPHGDVSGSLLERPPAWVDLLGATLTRSAEGWELRVRLAGGEAPDSTGSRHHTLNLAFFADLDGDGAVDAQIWANLADHGWGAGWFPPEPPNRFGDESEVVIGTDGDEVVLRFPGSHLPVERLRWSIASEWGRYEALGTDLTARDQAPDTGPASFP